MLANLAAARRARRRFDEDLTASCAGLDAAALHWPRRSAGTEESVMRIDIRPAASGAAPKPPSSDARPRLRRLYPDARATNMRRHSRASTARGGSGLFR